MAIIGKLGWIKRQRARFEQQARQSEREMVSGESHYFGGKRYRLRIVAASGPARVVITNNGIIELHVRPGASVETRQTVIINWYRQHPKEMVPPLIEKWQKRLGVRVTEFGIKRMKTKWGTCTVDARRIWINLELAKKSHDALEYVVMHELVHLLARHHDDRFVAIMDEHLPRWRFLREELNCLPLAHETWRD